ncbi:MAG: motility protein A [Spirochaetae bacterium HGW-Spirochaetae-1]|jgi:chemotaxis protein MotA|nr:MAG: motility protein A [Spirochaetae bacterium HGW-Spirochaetae-1]
MDISMPIGIIAGFVFIIFGILVGGGSVLMFWDPPSLLITMGGTIASMLVAYKIPMLMKLPKIVQICVFPPKYNPSELVITLVSFSEKARREGLLALEDDLDELDDQFMRKGLQLVVDGTDPELVRNIMEKEMENIGARHDVLKTMFDDGASFSPAFGMIGTLIGLVMMLANLEDKSTVGPFLAVALLTTLYGAILCYLFWSPAASRLDQLTGTELNIKSIILEGTLSIQAGDNPRIVKDKLISYLPPSDRESINEEVGE